ncbi:hypothetical protein LEP1GSC041_1307 [Leptospira noguchii str. 2006001870]|nr:hypothetical protein LEP1GSC041_1307 [Leptospira noguchii str. 2006001870]
MFKNLGFFPKSKQFWTNSIFENFCILVKLSIHFEYYFYTLK